MGMVVQLGDYVRYADSVGRRYRRYAAASVPEVLEVILTDPDTAWDYFIHG